MTKASYRSLVAAIERAINDADPIGLLGGGAPADEYSSEIGTIVPRVANVQSVDEITSVLHEEFVRWFGKETAGPRQAYEAAARHIWGAVHEFRGSVDNETPG